MPSRASSSESRGLRCARRSQPNGLVGDHGAVDWDDADDLRALVERLRGVGRENEWLEFKVDNAAPEEIGEYVSCLSNSAALGGQETGFLLWGVADEDRSVVGTTFDPFRKKVGAEDLTAWLVRLLEPHIDFSFHVVDVGERQVVVLRIAAAARCTDRGR